MKSIHRDLMNLSGLSAIVLAFALAWGGPFIVESPAYAQDQAQPHQQQQNHAKSSTFTGTIVKDGDQFVLRDAKGQAYKLDDEARAKEFEGKPVKVTGQLDEQAMLIHVESIEAAEG